MNLFVYRQLDSGPDMALYGHMILVLRAGQLVCLLVIAACMIMRLVDRWQNNHFVDDQGRRYRRTRKGFEYY